MTDRPRSGFSRRWLAFYVAVPVLAVLAGVFLTVNRTPSVRPGLYLVVPEGLARGEPAAGDLVVACAPAGEAVRVALERGYLPPGEACASGASPLLKRVVATGGQTVALSERGLAVDGRRVGLPPPTADRGGRPLRPAYGTRTLGPGALWLGSDIPNGFDSRYLGPLPPALRRARAWLLVPFG